MKKKTIVTIIVVILFAIGIVGVLAYVYLQQNKYDVDTFGLGVGHSEYKSIEYDGLKYTYNPRIDTFLYIGIDEKDGIEDGTGAGRADTIVLFVMDKDNNSLTAINFSRDTMTEIRSYDTQGNLMGTVTQHLAYAYEFAGGGKAGCQNVAWSVSNLLGGIPIEEYVATNISSIAGINDLVGGVTVTVPNDDLASIYPEMTTGAEVKLTSEDVEKFVRYRDTEEDFSNNGRLDRQKAFMDAFLPMFADSLSSDLDGTWNKLQTLTDNSVTSITKNEYIDIANNFMKLDLSGLVFYTPDGEDKAGENHDEFYIDTEALEKKKVEIFYVRG